MAGLLDAKSVIGVCRIRITPRQADCSFLPGANSYTLDAPLELAWSVNREDRTEINKKRLNNVACAPISTPGYDKSLEVTGKFCDFCTLAFAAFFKWTAYVDGADTYAIGRPLSTDSGSFCSVTGYSKFSLEIFTPVKQTSGICNDPNVTNIRIILPMLIDPSVGDVNFSTEDTTDFSFRATALGDNGTYGNGPFNDFRKTGAGAGTGSVTAGDGEIWEALPSNFVMPSASCTPTVIPAQA